MTSPHRPASIALVDISYLFKKNWETMPGKPAEATRKTLTDIDSLIAGVDHLILCRDAPPYNRAQKFAKYKAQRPAPEPEERSHKKWLFEQIKARGIQQAWCQGYEADDVIATLAKAYGVWCEDVRIVTSDKDAAQCVRAARVVQYVPPIGEKDWQIRDEAAVIAKFGVTPEQMPLWQALQGDDSDNIPGIKGVGPKTATDWVQWFKTLPGLIEALGNLDWRIKKAQAQKLADGLKDLRLYIELVTLDTAVPIDPEALLAPAEPAPEGREASLDVELTGFMGNETPPTSPEGEKAYTTALDLYHEQLRDQLADDEAKESERRRAELPPPRIGKDPGADEFLQKQAEARVKLAEFEAAQDKRETVADHVQQAYPTKREEALRAADKVISPPIDKSRAIEEVEHERVAEAEYDATSNGPGDKAAEPAVVQTRVMPPAPKPGLAKTKPDVGAVLTTDGFDRSAPDYGRVDAQLQPLDLRSGEVLAKWFAKGEIYPQFKTAAQIFTVISRARELGIGMHAALACTHMIEGKPVNHADLIRALAERDPMCEYLMPVKFSTTSVTWKGKHKKHPEPIEYTYTIQDAEAAGLLRSGAYGKKSNWLARPQDMLMKTAGSKLARLLWPGATLGLYCPEELSGQTMEELQEAA